MKKAKTISMADYSNSKQKYYWEDNSGPSIVAKTLSRGRGIPIQQANILLVEDNPVNLKTMELGLRSKVKSIRNAENGIEALEMFKRQHFDLILMDIQLPLMNGIETSREIRKMERNEAVKTPIIAITANFFSNAKEQALQAGVNAFLSKPFTRNTLIEIIEEFL